MFIIGLTGGLGTGKSTVLSMFQQNGVPVIDADLIAKDVLKPESKALRDVVECFGDYVLQPNGAINRVRLGKIVFNDIEKRKKLNAITHPRIQKAILKMALSHFMAGHKYIVMELPLLFETGKMLFFMHKIITVYCDKDQQVERVCKRNGFVSLEAKKRIDSQMPLQDKIAKSHFIIDNSGDLETTRRQTENIVRMLNRSKQHWYNRGMLGIFLFASLFFVAFCLYMLSKYYVDFFITQKPYSHSKPIK